jgi:uncharacterized membrane protein
MKSNGAKTGLELDAEVAAAKRLARSTLDNLVSSIRSRLISGLILALPIAITFWILYQLYATFRSLVLDPLASAVRFLVGRYTNEPLPPWWDQFVAPVVAMLVVVLVLYVLGLFVRSKLHRAIDWVMLHMPVVTIVYGAVTNFFQSIDRLKRVVLIPFPHPGARALAFVTNSLRDSSTGRTILSVWVVTGFMPPAGFTLFLPEEDVVDLDWTFPQALQAIISGGFTAPEAIDYFRPATTQPPDLSRPQANP